MSLGWFSIGAAGDISLTNVNVDNGTLFVDKNNDRVGIRTTTPAGVLQIGTPIGTVNPLNPLVNSGVTMLVNKSTAPLVSGSSDLSGTLWINSTATFAQNQGASIALGGRANDNQHITFGRISGIHNNSSLTPSGELVMETTTTGGQLVERFRIKSDGKVGMGVSNPEGGLHLESDVICTGLWNKGYRRDVADGLAFAPGSSTKIPHNSYVTTLSPSGTQVGWIHRIDGLGTKFIYGSTVDPSTGDCYVVGTFAGTLQFYDPGILTPNLSPNFTSGTGQMTFLAKIRENGSLAWAARLDVNDINDSGLGVAFVGGSVFITGTFEAGTFTAYNQGSFGTAFGTTLTSIGGGAGFIAKYSTVGQVEAVTKIDGIGDVVITCAQGHSTNQLFVGGYHNVAAGNLQAFNSNGTVGATAPASIGGSFDAFVCKYNTSLTPDWIVVARSVGDDVVNYPSRGIDVDGDGNLYVAGYASGSTSFRSANGTESGNFSLPVGSTRMGFLAKFSNAGAFQWASKITSNSTSEARSVSVTPGGRVYVVGDFLGTVSFRDAGDSSSVKATQQFRINSPPSDVRIGFLAQYNTGGEFLWSTKIQPGGIGSDKEIRMIGCDNDSFGNCYVLFHSIVTNIASNSSVTIFQRGSPNQATTEITNHREEGLGGVLGVAAYNSDGKVLYTSKIDSTNSERAGSLTVYQRTGGDQYPRLVISGWTFGRELTVTDPVGNVFGFLTGLPNQTTATNSGFVIHLPSLSTYVLEYPLGAEITRKFINVSPGRAFVIPYIDQFDNVDTAFTRGIFEATGGTSIELSYITPSTWVVASNQPSFLTTNNGNVGIGVARPTNLFEVEGTGSFAGNVGIGTKSTENRLSVYVNGANDVYAAKIEQANPLGNGLLVKGASATSSQKIFTVETNNTEVFSIAGDGQFRVGDLSLYQGAAGSKGMTISVGLDGLNSVENKAWVAFETKNSTGQTVRNRIAQEFRGNDYGLSFQSSTTSDYATPTTLMKIDNGGNVGIGTISPASKLEVRGGDIRVGANLGQEGSEWPLFFLRPGIEFFNNDLGSNNLAGLVGGIKPYVVDINGWTGLGIWTSTAPNNPVNFSSDMPAIFCRGQDVGIGNVNPAAKLHVSGNTFLNGNVGIGTTPTQRFHVQGISTLVGFTSVNTTLVDYPLRVAGQGPDPAISLILSWGGIGTAWFTYSDERIKKDINKIDDGNALQILRKIEPHTYRYKDNRTSDRYVYGFIAQEVRRHLPDAVNITNNFIPDVHRLCQYNNSTKEITIEGQSKDGKLKITHNGSEIVVNVRMINGDTVRVLDNDKGLDNIQSGNVFVYGYEIDDFHALKKDYLFTINFAATQEIDRRQQALQAENAQLKASLAAMEERLGRLEALIH